MVVSEVLRNVSEYKQGFVSGNLLTSGVSVSEAVMEYFEKEGLSGI